MGRKRQTAEQVDCTGLCNTEGRGKKQEELRMRPTFMAGATGTMGAGFCHNKVTFSTFSTQFLIPANLFIPWGWKTEVALSW